jgi:hypothetical protein
MGFSPCGKLFGQLLPLISCLQSRGSLLAQHPMGRTSFSRRRNLLSFGNEDVLRHALVEWNDGVTRRAI